MRDDVWPEEHPAVPTRDGRAEKLDVVGAAEQGDVQAIVASSGNGIVVQWHLGAHRVTKEPAVPRAAASKKHLAVARVAPSWAPAEQAQARVLRSVEQAVKVRRPHSTARPRARRRPLGSRALFVGSAGSRIRSRHLIDGSTCQRPGPARRSPQLCSAATGHGASVGSDGKRSAFQLPIRRSAEAECHRGKTIADVGDGALVLLQLISWSLRVAEFCHGGASRT